MSLSSLSYRDLQSLAKEHGVPANQKSEALREALEKVLGGNTKGKGKQEKKEDSGKAASPAPPPKRGRGRKRRADDDAEETEATAPPPPPPAAAAEEEESKNNQTQRTSLSSLSLPPTSRRSKSSTIPSVPRDKVTKRGRRRARRNTGQEEEETEGRHRTSDQGGSRRGSNAPPPSSLTPTSSPSPTTPLPFPSAARKRWSHLPVPVATPGAQGGIQAVLLHPPSPLVGGGGQGRGAGQRESLLRLVNNTSRTPGSGTNSASAALRRRDIEEHAEGSVSPSKRSRATLLFDAQKRLSFSSAARSTSSASSSPVAPRPAAAAPSSTASPPSSLALIPAPSLPHPPVVPFPTSSLSAAPLPPARHRKNQVVSRLSFTRFPHDQTLGIPAMSKKIPRQLFKSKLYGQGQQRGGITQRGGGGGGQRPATAAAASSSTSLSALPAPGLQRAGSQTSRAGGTATSSSAGMGSPRAVAAVQAASKKPKIPLGTVVNASSSIAALSAIPPSAASSSSSSSSSSLLPSRPKFDLAASLARRPGWQLKTGVVQPPKQVKPNTILSPGVSVANLLSQQAQVATAAASSSLSSLPHRAPIKQVSKVLPPKVDNKQLARERNQAGREKKLKEARI